MPNYYLEAPRCEHLKDFGVRCGSPALRGKPFCYHHYQIHYPRLLPGEADYKFPALECEEAVEITIRNVLQSFHDKKIDLASARFMIYSLQVVAPYACRNSPPRPRFVATEVPPAMQHLIAPSSPSVNLSGVVPDHPGTPILTASRSDGLSPAVEQASSPAPSTPSDPAVGSNEKVGDNTTDAAAPFEPSVSDGSSSAPTPGLIPHTPEEIYAYWTQHLPPEVRDLRAPSGDFVYTPPEWMPLSEPELAYLRDHLPPDGRRGTDQEQENLRTMTNHMSNIMVKPPTPDEIRKTHQDLWDDEKKAVAFVGKMFGKAQKLGFS